MAVLTVIRLILLTTLAGITQGTRSRPEDLPAPTFRQTSCRMLINEVNLYSDDIDNNQYVELSRYCKDNYYRQRSISMKGFKLMFISHDGLLLGMCELNNDLSSYTSQRTVDIGTKKFKQTRTYWYYLIGTGSANVNFNRTDCQLPPFGEITGSRRRFPVGVEYPIMIALVYNKYTVTLKPLELSIENGIYIETKLTWIMKDLIMKYLQDAYVYGSETPFQQCKYFENFYSFKDHSNVILRDWNVANQTDFSLSRCSKNDKIKQILPFQPTLWKYTKPTPGTINVCKNGFNFRIEDLQEPATSRHNFSTVDCIASTTDVGMRTGYISFADMYRREFEYQAGTNRTRGTLLPVAPLQPPPLSTPSCLFTKSPCRVPDDIEEIDAFSMETDEVPESSSTTARPSKLSQTLFEAELESAAPYIWTNCSKFPEADRNIISNLPGKPIILEDVLKPEVCNWFSYNQFKGLFTCKLCQRLVQQEIIYDKPTSKQITAIMRGGIMSVHPVNRKYQNRLFINEHANSIFHKMSTQWFSLYDAGLRGAELNTEFETSDGAFKVYTESTKNLIASAIYSVKLQLPYNKFQTLMELLNFVNVDVGFKHQNFKGVKTIVEIVSDTLHRDMINYLKLYKPVLTILLDGTTDVSTTSILAVLFQYQDEDLVTQIRLYRILKLDEGESGESIYNAFLTALKEDGLESYVKEKLQSVTSDGAPNIFNVFNQKLNEFSDNPVLRIWCQNHIYDLIYKHFIKKSVQLFSIPKIINKCACIFTKSPKAKRELDRIALENNIPVFSIKKTHFIRWVSSNVRALETAFDKWEYIIITLSRIVNDNTYSAKFRENAQIVSTSMKQPEFLTSLAYLLEISRILAKMSLSLQVKGSTLISKKSLRIDFQNCIESLNTEHLDTVTTLLTHSKLVQPDLHGGDDVNSLASFETQSIIFKNQKLLNPSQVTGSRLFELSSNYTQIILNLITHYFPNDIQDEYEVFNPSNFPVTQQRLQSYGVHSIKTLNTNLNWGFDESVLIESWHALITKVIGHSDYHAFKGNRPEDFWKHFMSLGNSVGFTNITTIIIKRALTMSASNAETERFLNLYSGVKTLRRYLLAPKSVEAILRVKTNINGKLLTSELIRYCKEFIMRGHSRSDEMGKRKLQLSKRDWDIIVQDDGMEDDDDDCESTFQCSNDTDNE